MGRHRDRAPRFVRGVAAAHERPLQQAVRGDADALAEKERTTQQVRPHATASFQQQDASAREERCGGSRPRHGLESQRGTHNRCGGRLDGLEDASRRRRREGNSRRKAELIHAEDQS